MKNKKGEYVEEYRINPCENLNAFKNISFGVSYFKLLYSHYLQDAQSENNELKLLPKENEPLSEIFLEALLASYNGGPSILLIGYPGYVRAHCHGDVKRCPARPEVSFSSYIRQEFDNAEAAGYFSKAKRNLNALGPGCAHNILHSLIL